MPYADTDTQQEYSKAYQSKDNMWRPIIFKRDLTDQHIHALRVQASINQINISEQMARYVIAGLRQDKRITTQSV